MRLSEKVILVTGSAAGVGEGIARLAVIEGAVVVTHGREGEPNPGLGTHLTGELEDPETPARLIEATVGKHGRLDGLVNNAGVSWRAGIDAPAALFDRIMAINARAPFLMVQAALPHLKGGSIVNVGSVNAFRGGTDLVPYAMSKAALATMTRTLAEGLAQDRVRINALNIGWTLTEGERALLVAQYGWDEDWPERTAERMPLGRMLLPEDAAAAAVFLLSDESKMISGQVWGLDQRPVAV